MIAREKIEPARNGRSIRWAQHAMRALALALVFAWLGLKLVPMPAALMKPAVQSREFTDRHGVTLREVRVDERFAREVTLDEIPPRVVHAMLAAEDKRFF